MPCLRYQITFILNADVLVQHIVDNLDQPIPTFSLDGRQAALPMLQFPIQAHCGEVFTLHQRHPCAGSRPYKELPLFNSSPGSLKGPIKAGPGKYFYDQHGRVRRSQLAVQSLLALS